MNKSEFFKDKKVLVAGGTGMVGSYLTLELLRRQASVRVMVHERPHTIQDDKIEYVEVLNGPKNPVTAGLTAKITKSILLRPL